MRLKVSMHNKHNRTLKAAGRARFAVSGRLMPCPCVAYLMLVMLCLTPLVAHLMLAMVLNMPEQCSFQDLLFHLLFIPKYAEKSASRMDISLINLTHAVGVAIPYLTPY